MNLLRHEQIGRAFAGAWDYDRHARVQRDAARALARTVAAAPLPAAPRLLEIGCGTGFLTEALLDAGLAGDWLVTDIAPEMVERCRRRMATRDGVRPALRYAALDGEYGTPDGAGGFDLIVSSLTFQWFDDLPAALARMLGWLAPGGRLLFATLGAGSFAEWRAAHAAEGLCAGTPPMPAAEAIAAILPSAQAAPQAVARIHEVHADGRAFLRSLKAIGAHTPAQRHRPLDPAALRRVLRRFEAQGAQVTYEIVTGHYRRGAA